jgi:uncharacterized surface protein with fasciclin (FAS1) repeats
MNERYAVVVLGIVASLTLSAGGTARLASAQGAPQVTTAQPQRTLLQIAEDTPAISTFVSLLERENMTGPLNDTAANYTVLAPDNAAFSNLGNYTASNYTAIYLENKTNLRGLLFNHIVQGTVKFTQNGDVTTLDQHTIPYSVNGSTVTLRGGFTANEPYERVTQAISGSNGVIYVIDGVLIPLPGAPAGIRVGPIGWPTTASTQNGSATASPSPAPVPGFDVLFGIGALTAVAACRYAMRFRRS